MDQSVAFDKRSLIIEIAVILAVVLGYAIIASVVSVVGQGAWNDVWHVGAGVIVLQELLAILLIVYIIGRRGESVRSFGCAFRLRVIPSSLVLFAASCVLYWLTYFVMESCGLVDAEAAEASGFMREVRNTPDSWLVAYILVGAVSEELTVRAYFMTRLRQLGCTTGLTILLSTLLQSCFHLHHGWLLLASVPMFLLFAVYYVRFRDVLAIMLVHVYFNTLVFVAWL